MVVWDSSMSMSISEFTLDDYADKYYHLRNYEATLLLWKSTRYLKQEGPQNWFIRHTRNYFLKGGIYVVNTNWLFPVLKIGIG